MSDFINKIVTIALIFILLVVSPLLISYKSDEMMAKRLILNDVDTFIEMVRDTGKITQIDLDNLYIQCNSHGLAVDVKVKRMVRAEVYKINEITSEPEVITVYQLTDTVADLEAMNKGDVVKVTVEEIGVSTGRRLTYNILKMDEGKFEFSLAGTVG